MPWSLPITADGAVKQKTVWNPEDSKKPEPGKVISRAFFMPVTKRRLDFTLQKKVNGKALQMEESPLYRGEVSSKALNKEVQEDSRTPKSGFA